MTDLTGFIAAIIILLIAALSFISVRYFCGQQTHASIPIVALLSAGVFCFRCNSLLLWAQWIPSSAVVVWANLIPAVLIAVAAGLLSRSPTISAGMRIPIGAVLAMVAVLVVSFSSLRAWVMPVQLDGQRPSGELVVLQSHRSTCGPAAAATLLKMHGIESNEKSMVSACMTCVRGTEALGLFRGVAIGTRNTDRSPRVASRNPAQWQSSGQLPNMSIVYFPKNEYDHNAKQESPRWFAGRGNDMAHVVVAMGRTDDGRWLIGDPAVGQTIWTNEEFERRFTGEAIFLSRQK